MTTIESRARGTLLGLAWGDVLGVPIEGWSPALIAEVFGAYRELPEAYRFERIPAAALAHLRPLGLHSDDTQQALLLVQVVLSPGGWHVDRWAASLVAGQAHGAFRGTGRFFRAAVARLVAGQAPQRAGSPSAGIGAAMRIGPLGALYRGEPARLRDVVFESSASTHADLRAVAIAHAVAFACSLLIEGTPAAAVLARLAAEVEAAERDWLAHRGDWQVDASHPHGVSAALAWLAAADLGDLDRLRRALVDRARPAVARFAGEEPAPNHPFAELGGLHALAVGLAPVGEPGELLAGVMRLGGDTDTVGAIAGTLLGARFGSAWIPRARMIDAGRLDRYADALVSASLPESLTDCLRCEAEHTAAEAAFLRGGRR
ncbi:MAG TPA: ADP-ribosylglycohydrolase family protein [Kofleriaceae bacterium]|nr:ADP-ribosylglycohydrolase family protein [Kofleriaceae bacterium]